jgi:hypothetical protein
MKERCLKMINVQLRNSVGFAPTNFRGQQLGSNPRIKSLESRDTVSFRSNPFEAVTLRTGIQEARILVNGTKMSLSELARKGPNGMLAVYDLAAKCRDPKYEFFGNAEKILQEAGLVQKDGRIHDSIKNIVLAATDVDGIDFTLVDPLKK